MARTSNKYAGSCFVCKRTVRAGEGVLLKRKGKWVVRHLDGCRG